MATRLNPQTGITVIENIFGHGLNPSFPGLYSATRSASTPAAPFPFRYEPKHAPSPKKIALEALEIASRPIEPAKAQLPPRRSRQRAASPSQRRAGGQAM